jgi:heat shock protein HtpX
MYDQIASNKRRSLALIFVLTIAVSAIVYVFSLALRYDALTLAGLALVLTGLYGWFSYYFSDKMVLGIARATQITKADAPDLFRLVENLCIGDGLPMPKVYIIDDTALNAFATGRDPQHASIAFTKGILAKLERAELEGVAAHELSHVKNYDIRMTSLVVVLVGVIALVSDWFIRMSFWGGLGRGNDRRESGSNPIVAVVAIVLALLTPLIAQLIQLAISRQREYLADASGALLTRYPEGLARALEKISQDTEPLEVANNATASLYIANPLKNGAASLFSNLFNTHPPIEERIKRLRSM